MKCPNCGLDKSLYTTICDCGFDFESEELESLNRKEERTMKCPSCGLTNPPEAMKCDCGYEFQNNQNINNTGVYDGSISCIKCGTLCGHGSHSTGRWVAIGLLSFFLFPFGLFSFFLLRGRKNYRCLKCGTQFRM